MTNTEHLAQALAALDACKARGTGSDREHAFDLKIHQNNVDFWTRKVSA